MDMYAKALEIAMKAHKGQVDKAGVEYIEHPKYVASLVSTEEEKTVALLHDVIEDSEYRLGDLNAAGFSENILMAVALLTKIPGSSYQIYLEGIKSNKLACRVKLADLKHNSDLARITNPTEKDYERLEKYKQAIDYLKN